MSAIFWLVVVLLIFVGLVFVLYPLIFPNKKRVTISRVEMNKTLYRGKVEDLQADLDKNLLDQEEYDQAVVDLKQTLLQDAAQEESSETRTGSNAIIALLVMVALPVIALLMYHSVSTGGFTNEISPQAQAVNNQVQSIESSIASLEAKLKDKPDSVEGWRMLGQSYFVIKKYHEARQAYLKALKLVNQSDPELLVLTAEASAFANGEKFADYEKTLLNKALSINPKDERGLWYSGYAYYTNSDFPKAVEYWTTLLSLVPGDRKDVRSSLLKFLSDARSRAGMEELEEPEQIAQKDSGNTRSINVSVSLNEKVNQKAESGDTLFIYARAVDGPKMPLSLARLTVSNLPAKVTLKKEMAMMPNMNIYTFEKVEVLARVSKSGQAITQKGDLISRPIVVDFSKSNTADITLDIDAIAE